MRPWLIVSDTRVATWPGTFAGMLSPTDLARLCNRRLCGTAPIESLAKQLTDFTVAITT
jgi:hypothetical protein